MSISPASDAHDGCLHWSVVRENAAGQRVADVVVLTARTLYSTRGLSGDHAGKAAGAALRTLNDDTIIVDCSAVKQPLTRIPRADIAGVQLIHWNSCREIRIHHARDGQPGMLRVKTQDLPAAEKLFSRLGEILAPGAPPRLASLRTWERIRAPLVSMLVFAALSLPLAVMAADLRHEPESALERLSGLHALSGAALRLLGFWGVIVVVGLILAVHVVWLVLQGLEGPRVEEVEIRLQGNRPTPRPE